MHLLFSKRMVFATKGDFAAGPLTYDWSGILLEHSSAPRPVQFDSEGKCTIFCSARVDGRIRVYGYLYYDSLFAKAKSNRKGKARFNGKRVSPYSFIEYPGFIFEPHEA